MTTDSKPAISDARQAKALSRRARIIETAEANHVPLRTILVVVGLLVTVFVAAELLYRMRGLVVLMLVGGFIALILNPQVVALQRWKVHRRGVAVAIVTSWAVLVFVGLAFAFGYPLVNTVTHLADNLPGYVDKAEHGRGWLGHFVRRYHLDAWVQKNSPKLVNYAEGLSKPALSIGKGAAGVLATLFTTFVFVVLLLLEAPKMRTWILGSVSEERAATWTRVGTEVSRSVSGYVLGDVLTSIIAGVVVSVTLAILSVPFALLWGLWVGLVDFLPTIGGALAGIPTVLFALSHSVTAGLVTAVVFVVYTQVENHILNPVIMSRTVKVNPLLIMLSVLVGAEIGSWVGGLLGGFAMALLSIPIVGGLQVIVREIWSATLPAASPVPLDPAEHPAVSVQTASDATLVAEVDTIDAG